MIESTSYLARSLPLKRVASVRLKPGFELLPDLFDKLLPRAEFVTLFPSFLETPLDYGLLVLGGILFSVNKIILFLALILLFIL